MNKLFVSLLLVLSFVKMETLLAQIPVIKAVGGEGRNVDWPMMKRTADPDGPGFFYNDCDQGVTPLRASSTLPNQGAYNYSVRNLNDNNPMTAWVEGISEYGIGEYFEIKAAGVNAIYNGYQSSPKSWADNSRVKRFKVYKNNTALCYLDLTDEMGRQRFELPDHAKYNPDRLHVYRFEIVEAYRGLKWQDVAISEIDFGLCCFSSETKIMSGSSQEDITEVHEGDEINVIDLKDFSVLKSKVEKTTRQKHLSILRITCGSFEIEATPNHPFYIKGEGFTSISRFMEMHDIENPYDLVGRIEFMVWDGSTEKPVFEKLTAITLETGEFVTYGINSLGSGNTFLANGFITRTY